MTEVGGRMACSQPPLPDDALYLDENILKEPVDALSRSLYIINDTLGYTNDTSVNRDGFPEDWRGLAYLMGFDRQDVQRWEEEKHKTEVVINKWAKTGEQSTIKALLDYFRQLHIYSLLRNSRLIEAIVDDVERFRERRRAREEEARREAEQRRLDEERAEQLRQKALDPLLRPNMQRDMPHWFNEHAKNHLVLGDQTKIRYFDAFVCYAYEDIKFVKQMLNAMEKNVTSDYNGKVLDLCVSDRDFYVGAYKYTLTARVMEERCKRIVLIMSPDFVKTPMCAFQTEYALSLSPGAANKKLLPVMYRNCDVPAGLKHIAGLYYTRDELKEWFWPRLRGSLHADLQWDEKVDHEKEGWDQLSLNSESICPATREEIEGAGKKSHSSGMSKSGSSSSIDSIKSDKKSSSSKAGASPLSSSVGSKSSQSGSGADPPGATGGAEEDAEPLDPAAEAAHKLGSGAHCQADFEITEMPDMSLGAAPGVASNKTPNGHSRLATPAPSKASSSKKLKFPSIFPKKKEIAK